MKKKNICIIILLFFLLVCKAFAEEYKIRNAIVLVFIQSQDIKGEQYREVIEDAVKIKLESAKFQVLLDKEISNMPDETAVFKTAENLNADFVITGIYSIENRLLEIDFLWYDTQFRRVSEPYSERIVMDLGFDDKISETVNEIILLMNERIKEFPLIIAYLCNWCSYVGADLAGTSKITYPTNVRTIHVMCTAMLNPSLIFESFFYGADGVLIAGCHPQDCHYETGFQKAEIRYESIKEMLAEAKK